MLLLIWSVDVNDFSFLNYVSFDLCIIKKKIIAIATFHGNSFQGTMPEPVCALNNEDLTRLTADCVEASQQSSPPFVSCSCCTQCY